MRDFFLEQVYGETLIEESAKNRYMQMFEPIFKKALSTEHVRDYDIDDYVDFVQAQIRLARDTLKREDRIMWYLRYVKLTLLKTLGGFIDEFKPIAKDYTDTMVKHALKGAIHFERRWIKYGLETFKNNDLSLRDIRGKLAHFLSLNINEIENFEFRHQYSGDIEFKFRGIEEEWKKSRKEWIDVTDDIAEGNITHLFKFEDGFAWVNLNSQYCHREGNAMGHCGNSADYDQDDTVLSLRKFKKEGDRTLSRPSLTFIRHGDGFLGEMKARANEKPKEKYHPYILMLLTLKTPKQPMSSRDLGKDLGVEWLVKGIRGGGYRPQNNFSLGDLSDDRRKLLYSVRPELKTLKQIYLDDGLTGDIKTRIEQEYNVNRFHDDRVVLNQWKNWEEMLHDFSERELPNLYAYAPYIRGDSYLDFDLIPDRNSILDLWKQTLHKHPEYEAEIKEYLATEYDDDEMLELEEVDLYDFLNERDHAIVDDYLYHAIIGGFERGAESEMYTAFVEAISNFSIEKGNERVWVDREDDQHWLDSPIMIQLTIIDLLDIMEIIGAASKDYNDIVEYMKDDKDKFEDMTVPYYGFSDYDEEYAMEYFIEQLRDNGVI